MKKRCNQKMEWEKDKKMSEVLFKNVNMTEKGLMSMADNAN